MSTAGRGLRSRQPSTVAQRSAQQPARGRFHISIHIRAASLWPLRLPQPSPRYDPLVISVVGFLADDAPSQRSRRPCPSSATTCSKCFKMISRRSHRNLLFDNFVSAKLRAARSARTERAAQPYMFHGSTLQWISTDISLLPSPNHRVPRSLENLRNPPPLPTLKPFSLFLREDRVSPRGRT